MSLHTLLPPSEGSAGESKTLHPLLCSQQEGILTRALLVLVSLVGGAGQSQGQTHDTHVLLRESGDTCRVTSQDFLYTPSTPEAPKPSTRFWVSLNGTTSGASRVRPCTPHGFEHCHMGCAHMQSVSCQSVRQILRLTSSNVTEMDM